MAENTARVLIVDDERFYREAIREALAGAGIACETADDGELALAAAAESDFGVVVLDIGLPGMSGVEVLSCLREHDPSLRVIVLSVPSEQDAVLEALRLDACDYLAKPLHDEELVLAVRRALRSHEVETKWSTLRDRVCALDARVADLFDRARECDPAERVDALGDHIAETVSVVLGAAKASLMVMDEDGGALRVVAATGHDVPAEEMEPVAPGEGVAGRAISEDAPFVIPDLDADERFAGRHKRDQYTSTSLVVTPIAGGARSFGVLCATDREDGGAFGAEDLALLRVLAFQVGQIVGAPASARPPARARTASLEDSGRGDTQPLPYDAGEGTDAAELARMICDVLTTEIEPDRTIAGVLRVVAQSLPAAPVALYLIENKSGSLMLEGQVEGAGSPDRESVGRGSGLTGMVLQTGHLVATDHPDKDPRFAPDVDTPADGSVRPLVCVPVQVRGKTLGVLRAFPTGSGASARTAEMLVAAVSAAVRNVLLYRNLLESIDEVARVRRESRGRR
jgi:DNA-binding NarL/FixJ family response regulator/putative methionine-R-sulfoxide reductase with GAF domain